MKMFPKNNPNVVKAKTPFPPKFSANTYVTNAIVTVAIGLIVAIIIPIIFFYIGIKTQGLRKAAFSIAIGVILYAIGAILVAQSIIELLRKEFGNNIIILTYLLFFVDSAPVWHMDTHVLQNVQFESSKPRSCAVAGRDLKPLRL